MSIASASIARVSDAAIAEAAQLLQDGELIAFPTETVYGLGADATNAKAVARIFEVKGRPTFNPLIVHIADLAMADTLVELPPRARALAQAFWPGALTLVAPRKPGCPVSELASAGLNTLAVRAPAHAIAQDLIKAAGVPIAAPSANASEALSPTRATHVAESLGDRVQIILDGGPCILGLESTVIGFDGDVPVLLRVGAIPRAEIERVVGAVANPSDTTVRSPGQLARHYAPKAPLRLDADGPRDREAWLGFGADSHGGLNLSAKADLTEAAANLYAHLRALDASAPNAIAVARIPHEGLGEAINDRLARAATPKDLAP